MLSSQNSSPKSWQTRPLKLSIYLAASLNLLLAASSLANADTFISTPTTAIPTTQAVQPLDGSNTEDDYFVLHPDARTNVLSNRNLNDGYYLGLALGSDAYHVKRSSAYSGAGVSVSASDASSTTGYIGRVFAGVGKYFEGYYYLGTELYVSTNGANQNDYVTVTDASNSIPSRIKFTVSTTAGLSLLPGIKLNKSTLFYLRVGYNKARLKAEEQVMVNATTIASSSKANWAGGFTFGLGLESTMYCHFSLRADYSHTNYSTFSSPSTIKYSPSDNQFNLGLIYHFT